MADDARASDQPNRRKLWALAGIAAIGAGIYGYVRHRDRAAAEAAKATRQRAGQAWANMQQCLLGGKLSEVPSLAARVRRIELARTDGTWPGGCAEHVSALFQTLDDRTLGPALKQQLRERFACDQACNPHDPAAQLSGLYDPAALAALPDVAPTVPAPAMIRSAFIGKEQMPQLAPGDARARARDYLADGRAHYLFNSRGKGLSLCTIAPDAEQASRCKQLSLGVTPATAELAPGADEPIIVAKRGSLDTPHHFNATGREVALHRGRRSGFTLDRIDDGTYSVEHVREGEVTAKRRLKIAENASPPILVHDVLLHTEEGDGSRVLVARRLTAEGEELSTERERMGPADGLRGAPQSCIAGEQRALLFGRTRTTWRMVFVGERYAGPLVLVGEGDAPAPAKPASNDEKAPEQPEPTSDARKAALEDAKKFGLIELLEDGSEPEAEPWRRDTKAGNKGRDMWAEQLGGSKRPRRAPLPRYAFNCDESSAAVTWRSPAGETQIINEVRCSAEQGRCVHRSAKLSGLDVKTWWTATTLRADGGEKVLLVWRDGEGLLRARLAPLDQLAAAEDVLVMDSAEHGGPTTLDLEAVYGRTAAVFLFRGKGFHALRFGADGTFEPLSPTSW
jgi:hypothetical protein